MTTKEIRTSQAHVSCDVCGRTLLRGERADVFIAGGDKRDVCELCQPRVLHEGWVREGAVLERGTGASSNERRRGFFSRWRRSQRARANGGARHAQADGAADDGGRDHAATRRTPELALTPERELRQVHAVPTSVEQRTASAIELFNASEHPRTIAGVARSLGEPVAVARALEEAASIVTIVVSWELCWYRYEVDLDSGSVRAVGQGYELAELDPVDRVEANAVADEFGLLQAL